MKNAEFKIDTKHGVVVVCQTTHGKNFTSVSKTNSLDKFNVGIGQLIALKRNQIAIRKNDIYDMEDVLETCKTSAEFSNGTDKKLWSNFVQIASDKINMSRNHIRELKRDLKTLCEGTYDVKPYSEICEENKKIKKTYKPGIGRTVECEIRNYCVPEEIMNGTHMYAFKNGSIDIVPIEK